MLLFKGEGSSMARAWKDETLTAFGFCYLSLPTEKVGMSTLACPRRREMHSLVD